MLLWIIVLAIFAGLYMAWSIGSNDVANSMATAVGAKAITLKQALIIASILNFTGAILVGTHVTDTIKNRIVDVSSMSQHSILLGFLAALLSAAFFVTLSTWKELPVSTTHAVVGGIAGFGLIQGGMNAIQWKEIGMVVSSWVISPIVGGIISFIIFKLIAKSIFSSKEPIKSAKNLSPFFVGLTIFIITLSIFMKTRAGEFLNEDIKKILLVSLFAAVISSIIGYFLIKKVKEKGRDYGIIEKIFRKLQVMTSCYVAFSHGANDVANAAAPVAVVLSLAWHHVDTIYILALGGFGIALGILTWGHKVISTVGSKITSLTNTRGFSIDFAVATVVLTASKLGLPISTSHTVVGAVIGVGLARGLEAVDLSIVKKIIYAWLFTLPASMIVSILIYMGLSII
ncbi:MAG: inorganic phosphate transporter [Thermoplasmata archaeon]|nr:MAG: inorganic phosphate transporter [Thermoplasmata archaeon]